MGEQLRDQLSQSKRIVVKLGSSAVITTKGFNRPLGNRLARQIAGLQEQGKDVILVSSGAVSLGHRKLNWPVSFDKLSVPERQMLSAVGQSILMQNYREVFEKIGREVGQILLSAYDVRRRDSFLHLRNAMESLIKAGVLPIINENDSVAIEELLFGDNDTLGANVSLMMQADALVLLTDVDGLYLDNQLVFCVQSIDRDIRAAAGNKTNTWGTGGIRTKIEAAQLMMSHGRKCIIANYHSDDLLTRLFNGEKIGTLFYNPQSADRLYGKRRWIALGSDVKGQIHVDEGAARQVMGKGRSLLAKGVVGISGVFAMGDLVEVVCDQKRIAKGLVHFSSKDMERIRGAHSSEIASILGRKTFETVIHRNNLVLLESGE